MTSSLESSSSPKLRKAALLFGLNYTHTSGPHLHGCIRDVENMAAFLRDVHGFTDTRVYTDADESPAARAHTSKAGLLRHLRDFAAETRAASPPIDFVWIHYSGHGSWIRDARRGAAKDESDGRDECLVPCDYETAGLLLDDELKTVWAQFAPGTRVVCVFDSCFSGTVADLKYSWGTSRVPVRKVEQAQDSPPSRVIALSGCLDTQTSADALGLVPADATLASGAMTSCLLMALSEPDAPNDVFTVTARLRALLRSKGFSQVPLLTSSFNLTKDTRLFL